MQQYVVPEAEKLFTFREAMDYLKVSRSTLYRLMLYQKLKGCKVGGTWRFYLKDLKACIH